MDRAELQAFLRQVLDREEPLSLHDQERVIEEALGLHDKFERVTSCR